MLIHGTYPGGIRGFSRIFSGNVPCQFVKGQRKVMFLQRRTSSLISFPFVWIAALSLLEWRSLAKEDCAGLAAAGDCEFYRCLDRQLGGCGSQEYPLGFGHKYCKRFQDSKELFDHEVISLD